MSNYKAGSYLFEEISSQGRAWAELIPAVLRRSEDIRELFQGVETVIFTGCGSALNVSVSAAPLFQMLTGIAACALPAAETYLYPSAFLPVNRRTLAVLLSRSGKTTEVVSSLGHFRERKTPTLGITCTADSPLARDSDLSLALASVAERAVATTRSLTGMILAVQLIAAIVARNDSFLDELQRLPEAFAARREEYHQLGKLIGAQTTLERYAFVGSGLFFGCARESQLKIKETTLLPADAYPMLDFRHGPQSNVGPSMLLTAFLSDQARRDEIPFLRDMRSLGGVIWAICERGDENLRSSVQHLLELESNLSEPARLPLCMPAVQYMAYYRALSLNLNPDEPRNLSYWVQIPT